MSCPHLHPDTIAECTQAAFDHDPAYYCVFGWIYAEMPPGRKYLSHPNKWLQVQVWQAMGESTDQRLLGVDADTGPELLRNLRGALAGLSKPAAPAPPRPVGNGWIASVRQTTQELTAWPAR